MVQDKLAHTQNEINEIEQQISKAKQKVEQTEAQVLN
jgi:cell division protein FtsL